MTAVGAVAQRPRVAGIVVSAHPAATDAGRQILATGGNAVDAAVAAAWALCVCEPSGSGLGGQTVALVRTGGRAIAVDGHSRAPAGASRQVVSRAQQRRGYRATTVPTTPATLAHLQSRYGRLSMADTLAPAIALAERGYVLTPLAHRQLRWCATALAATAAATRFLRAGRPYRPGETFRQPRLAACLRRLAEAGAEDFYHGAIARSIDRDMRLHGGLLQLSDLAGLQAPVEREPLVGRYAGRAVLTLPAPGGGPQLLAALAALARRSDDGDRPGGWHGAVAEAVLVAFEDREADHRAGPAQPGARPPAGHLAADERGGETSHLCAADDEGTVVSLTQSIQSLFGAKVANADYGFLYNNYLTTCPRRRHRHRLAAGCPARSNAAPTFVLAPAGDDGPEILALGAAGSRRIISSLVQVISGVVDLGRPLPEALAAPRVHPRLSGTVWLERPAATPALVAALARRHGTVEIRAEHSYAMGAVQALTLGAPTAGDRPRMAAAADPRRDGSVGQW